ncbi:MAG: SGNH/GDSL hydrolase family protein [Chitinophagaceae bacterium]|nr:MAG: SGNH/GDSL hydrolase family protein [Chitinophagaceae bacterium]
MKSLTICLIIITCLFAFTPRKRTWTALGDSITYLNDHPDETGDRISKGYLTLLKEKDPGLEIINQGHNGWSAVGIAKEIDKLGLVKSDLYSVFLGTNDWWQGQPLGSIDDYKNNTGAGTSMGAFRIIISKFTSLNPAASIILITPMQRGDFVYINDLNNNAYGSYKPKNGQQLSEFAHAIKQIGELEHLEVVDLFNESGMTIRNAVKFKWLKDPATGRYRKYNYPEYIGVPFDPARDEYPYPLDAIDYTYDGLHPSDKGYLRITEMLSPFIISR